MAVRSGSRREEVWLLASVMQLLVGARQGCGRLHWQGGPGAASRTLVQDLNWVIDSPGLTEWFSSV